MTIKIKFSGNELTRQFDAGATVTVSSIITDASMKAALGFGSNVEAQLAGQTLSNDAILRDGDVITVVTKANSKAA